MLIMFAQITGLVLATGAALVTLGLTLKAAAAAMGGLAVAVTAAAAVLKALKIAFLAMLSPIGLVITAVAGLGALILHVTGVAGEAIAWLGRQFQRLAADTGRTFQGMADAVVAGDLSLAFRVLWQMIRMEWTRGINFLEKSWLDFRNFFLKVGWDAWHGLLGVAQTVWHALEVGWIDFTSRMQRGWERATTAIANAWDWVVTGVAEGMAEVHGLVDADVDVRAVQRDLRDQRNRRRDQREEEREQRIGRIDREQDRRREAQQRLHRQTMAEIGRQNIEKHRQLDDEYAKRLAANEADLARARAQWQAAIDEAQRRREAHEKGDELEPAPAGLDPDSVTHNAEAILKALGLDDDEEPYFEGLGDLLAEQVAHMGARGTFNAAAALGLQAGGPIDRMAEGIDKIERNTRPLRDADGLAFE